MSNPAQELNNAKARLAKTTRAVSIIELALAVLLVRAAWQGFRVAKCLDGIISA